MTRWEKVKRRLGCFIWGHIDILVLGGDIMCMCTQCGRKLRRGE